MARIRTIKPEMFRHRLLYELELETGLPIRLSWAGLFTCCDREGRFKWHPREMKLDVLPYDDVDFSLVLDALEKYEFIVRYELDGYEYGYIPTWASHQAVNTRETASRIPEPPVHVHARARTCISRERISHSVNVPKDLAQTVKARDSHKCTRCGSTESLTIDHIFPRCIGGTHKMSNLRTLCMSCNCDRPVSGQALIDDLARDGLTLSDMDRICMHVHARAEHGTAHDMHVHAQGEGEGEGNMEGKGRERKGKTRAGRAPPSPLEKKTSLPEDFSISESVRSWAEGEGKTQLDLRLQCFKDYCLSTGKRYVDWDAAFRRSIRDDWAHLDNQKGNGSVTEKPRVSHSAKMGEYMLDKVRRRYEQKD